MKKKISNLLIAIIIFQNLFLYSSTVNASVNTSNENIPDEIISSQAITEQTNTENSNVFAKVSEPEFASQNNQVQYDIEGGWITVDTQEGVIVSGALAEKRVVIPSYIDGIRITEQRKIMRWLLQRK